MQPYNENPQADGVPPRLASSEPPVISAPPLLAAGSPPLGSPPKTWHLQHVLAVLLSLCLAAFLADAVVSIADDLLILLFDAHLLSVTRGILAFAALLLALLTYGLMGLTPMIPKRLFLPLSLFYPAGELLLVAFFIYFHHRIQQGVLVLSAGQLLCGLGILYWARKGLKLGWPLIPDSLLESRRFSWLNLSGFVLVNVFVLLPAVIGYLFLCASLAAGHFSQGFLALRPSGVTVQVRKYARDDGKTIQLVPMAHIGERDFYRKLAGSFSTNSIILMEGVTDTRNLLTNRITYKRMATSLGLAEQQKEFRPSRSQMVWADVDVEEFATNTIGFLNVVMILHSKGVNSETVMKLLQYSPPPHLEQELLADLLTKRNRNLLQRIHAQLSESDSLIVPWGVAHMPEVAAEIQKSGFHLEETREYQVIRFGFARTRNQNAGARTDSQNPN